MNAVVMALPVLVLLGVAPGSMCSTTMVSLLTNINAVTTGISSQYTARSEVHDEQGNLDAEQCNRVVPDTLGGGALRPFSEEVATENSP